MMQPLSAALIAVACPLVLGGAEFPTESRRRLQDAETCAFSFKDDLPIDTDDFNHPDWKAIIEKAFPPWKVPRGGCPRLKEVGGSLEKKFSRGKVPFAIGAKFPVPEEGKFNPCYYTKAFAGLDPKKGGYPTPIDTKYVYEFAAPFFGQPGDGSTHHCPMNADPLTPVQSCPKVGTGGCGEGVKDCNVITDEFGIGHVPPFVPLAAVRNAFLGCEEDVCQWFDDDVNQCNIKKSVLDRLVTKTFGTEDGKIKFTPPKILDDLPATDPKSTYYKLEYLDDPEGCKYNNCRGPHYCSKEAAEEDIWGDFCPYIHTGENSGQYRHPHLALAALELWIANKCKPEVCPSTWLDSPNGQGYGTDAKTSTSITWSEMEDNEDPMAQPIVPYEWPNSGDGIFPGKELYDGLLFKPVPGNYVTKFVAAGSKPSTTMCPVDPEDDESGDDEDEDESGDDEDESGDDDDETPCKGKGCEDDGDNDGPCKGKKCPHDEPPCLIAAEKAIKKESKFSGSGVVVIMVDKKVRKAEKCLVKCAQLEEDKCEGFNFQKKSKKCELLKTERAGNLSMKKPVDAKGWESGLLVCDEPKN